ncbi:hypothetical protein GIB67_040469 [Kingdonia uniflora]|uniref:F-box/FBD/LRR-repeat protein n=1 Tax=Kingdonia uniflora TaxID=39325 RepID=A0A7J7L542_9MAGN|nr:hypothetical protein GIB67_040469 [Kingdonia uniflora]
MARASSTLTLFDLLPQNVTDNILVRLPLKEAVRTSILSKSWRYQWVTIPELIIPSDFELFPSNELHGEEKIVSIVDHVLKLHKGHLQKFMLDITFRKSNPDLDGWILHLSTKGIKELVLEILTENGYKMHVSIFSCQQLTVLDLASVHVELPSEFTGFKSLKSLKLHVVTITENDLESLISRSIVLERLILLEIEVQKLKINAPNLNYCFIGDGPLEELYMETTRVLAFMHIFLSWNVENVDQGKSCNLAKLLGFLPAVEKLELDNDSLKVLSVCNIPRRLPNTLERLKDLYVLVNLKSAKEIIAALCLFRNSPCLRHLRFFAYWPKDDAMLRDEDLQGLRGYFDCAFPLLETVDLKIEVLDRVAILFIKFILGTSPKLKKMTICLQEMERYGCSILNYLDQLQGVSVDAEVVLLDWDFD